MPANQHRLPRSAADGGFSWWWWRKLSKREWTIAAALSVFLIILSPIPVSRTFTNTNTNSGTSSEWVPFTPLSKAQENSACNNLSLAVNLFQCKRKFKLKLFYRSTCACVDSVRNNCSLFGWECAWISFKKGFWIWL